MTETKMPAHATSHRNQDNIPTQLQHDAAKLLATIMRLALPSRIDKLQVLACLVSAAVGDDEPENLSEFGQRVQSISHAAVLDMSGKIDPDSAAWKARIAHETMTKPGDAKPHDGWHGPRDSSGAPCRLVNHYRCKACGFEWQDQRSCACNDHCPSCDAEIEP